MMCLEMHPMFKGTVEGLISVAKFFGEAGLNLVQKALREGILVWTTLSEVSGISRA